MMTKDARQNAAVQAMVSGFLRPEPEQSPIEKIVGEVAKDRLRLNEALKLFEAMYKEGVRGENDERGKFIPLEDTLMGLYTPDAPHRDRELAGISYALVHIGSHKAIENVAKLFVSIKDPSVREKVWGELDKNNSLAGLKRQHLFVETLKDKRHLLDREDRQEAKNYREIFQNKLFALVKGEDSKKKTYAYDTVHEYAQRFDISCLKFMLELEDETGTAFEHAVEIMKTMPAKWTGFDEFLQLENLVFERFKTPEAYNAYISIASEDFDKCNMAISEFNTRLGKAEAKPYIDRLEEIKGLQFLKAEQMQREHPGNGENYLRVAAAYYKQDPLRSLSMIARQNASGRHEIETTMLSMLEEYAITPEQKDHCYNILIERNSDVSLMGATQFVFSQSLDVQNTELTDEQAQELQKRKKQIIYALGELLKNTDRYREFDILEHLCGYAQIAGFANDETTEDVIKVLASLDTTDRAKEKIFNILAASYPKDARPPWKTPNNGDLVEFEAKGHKAAFAMSALIESGNGDRETCTAIKDIANRFGGDLPQQARDYFSKLGSPIAIAKIIELEGIDPSIQDFKKLPPSESIHKLVKAFAKNAYGSTKALISLRQEALADGQNDVANFDQAIGKVLKKLAGDKENSHPLLSRIRNNEQEQLRDVFDQLANADIVDMRQYFEAAIHSVSLERALGDSLEAMKNLYVPLPEGPART